MWATLSKVKNTLISGLVEVGLLKQQKHSGCLLSRQELTDDWDPATDTRLTVWEVTQHLIREQEEGSEQAAASLLRAVGSLAKPVLEFASRL